MKFVIQCDNCHNFVTSDKTNKVELKRTGSQSISHEYWCDDCIKLIKGYEK